MSAVSSDSLELRALMQRERIHRTALELIGKVDEAKAQLSLEHIVRQHFGIASLIAGAVTFLSGYAIGSAFRRR
jgi:uncharacterized membrane protein